MFKREVTYNDEYLLTPQLGLGVRDLFNIKLLLSPRASPSRGVNWVLDIALKSNINTTAKCLTEREAMYDEKYLLTPRFGLGVREQV